MSYQFNEQRFSQLCAELNFNNVTLQAHLGMTNTTPINRWRNGEHMYSKHIVRVCNAFGISPAEFFLQDGQPFDAPDLAPTVCTNSDAQNVQIMHMQQEMTYIKEKAELERQHLQEIADMKCEHTKELMTKEVELARREASMRESIRAEVKAEYEKEIATLRSQLLELSAQYKELEIIGGGQTIHAVADNKGSNYIAAPRK